MEKLISTLRNGDAAQGGISGLGLKLIAIATMLVDHIAAIYIKGVYSFRDSDGVYVFFDDSAYNLYIIMRIIGRMAFPIFCFLLIQGFYHTKSRMKYAITLFVFGIISELPYDLALEDSIWNMHSNNVMWTLLLGLITIWGLEEIRTNPRFLNRKKNKIMWYIATLLRSIVMMTVVMLSMICAEYWICCDYGASGIAAIVIMYLLYYHPMLGFAAGVVLLGLLGSEEEFIALLMLIPIYCYNGQRGKMVNGLKYIFYAFYPIHLILIWGIKTLV